MLDLCDGGMVSIKMSDKSSKHQTFFSLYLLLVRLLLKFHDIHSDVHELAVHMNEMRTFGVYVRALMWNIWFCVCLSFLRSFLSSVGKSVVPIYDFLYSTIFQGNSRLLAWNVIEIKFILSFWKGLFSIEHVLFLAETKPMVRRMSVNSQFRS